MFKTIGDFLIFPQARDGMNRLTATRRRPGRRDGNFALLYVRISLAHRNVGTTARCLFMHSDPVNSLDKDDMEFEVLRIT